MTHQEASRAIFEAMSTALPGWDADVPIARIDPTPSARRTGAFRVEVVMTKRYQLAPQWRDRISLGPLIKEVVEGALGDSCDEVAVRS
jgi:hypothetical protein